MVIKCVYGGHLLYIDFIIPVLCKIKSHNVLMYNELLKAYYLSAKVNVILDDERILQNNIYIKIFINIMKKYNLVMIEIIFY